MKTMKTMETIWHAALIAVAVALLAASMPMRALATEKDDRIEATAKESYVFKTYLKDDGVNIKSTDGVVTLTGTVAQESHKSLAQETVASLPGVKSVDNKITVKGEGADAENSDAWITMKVKTTLLFHKNVSVMTEVDTKDGIVTLRGEAANQAQKDLTTEHVKDIEGVKDVDNEMTVTTASVKPGEKTVGEKVETVGEAIDDASITGLIKMTLLYHRSTSALHTKVETSKGVVTLEGVAKNAAEKDLVTKYVQDVNGVKDVVNNMTIGVPETK
jgi:osmotically-inducible protein OsmY